MNAGSNIKDRESLRTLILHTAKIINCELFSDTLCNPSCRDSVTRSYGRKQISADLASGLGPVRLCSPGDV